MSAAPSAAASQPGAGQSAAALASAWRIVFCEWFGVTRATAELLSVLYAAQGELRTGAELARSAGVASGAIHYHVHKLRAALESEALDTGPEGGYRLTEEGLAECRAALRALAHELAGAP